MTDMTFAEQMKAYERWKQGQVMDWDTPARYEAWLELTRKAALWDLVSEVWGDDEDSAEAVDQFIGTHRDVSA